MLSWFVSPNHVIAALDGSKLTEDSIETIPEQVDNACLSDNICLATIRRFFLLQMPGNVSRVWLLLSNRTVHMYVMFASVTLVIAMNPASTATLVCHRYT